MRIGLLLVLPLLAFATLARGEEVYSLKQDQPSVGTRIRQNIASWVLPLNSSYEQLRPEHIEMLRAAYENLPPEHEPPYPIGGMISITKQIAKAQRQILVSGQLFAAAHVDANGDVQSLRVFTTPSADMAKVAAFVLMRTKFKPARCDGAPCSMEFPVQITFKVR